MFLLLKRRFAPKFVQNHGSAVQKVFFRLTCAAQKRGSRLKVLLKITTENGIYSHPIKVISNIILFVYSLHGALVKIARGCYTWWRNYFDGTTPLTAISKPWGRGWHVHQPTTWPVPNSCAKPNYPGVSRQLSRPRGVLIREHQNMKYQQVHNDKPINMIKPSDLWTADSSSWNSFHVKNLQARNWVVDYFHIEDRASITGHAQTIFCVHVSSLWVSALTFLYSGCSGFITQWKYSLLLEVIFTIYLTHNWRKFMNK